MPKHSPARYAKPSPSTLAGWETFFRNLNIDPTPEDADTLAMYIGAILEILCSSRRFYPWTPPITRPVKSSSKTAHQF